MIQSIQRHELMSNYNERRRKEPDELPEQLREIHNELSARDQRQRFEAQLLHHEPKFGSLSPGLRAFLADWPGAFERRLAAGERMKGLDAHVPLSVAYPKALEIFFASVDERGLEATLRELVDHRFSCENRYCVEYRDSRWDVCPTVEEVLFGTGRTLLPWLAERHHEGDYDAACWLCEIAPHTPELAESILTRLVEFDEFWDRLRSEAAERLHSRRYYQPFSLARCAEYALRFVRPKGVVPLESLPPGGRSIFYHAARSNLGALPTGADPFDALVALLSSSNRTERRRATLAIYYYPDFQEKRLAERIRDCRSDDTYIVDGCRLAGSKPGHLSQLATPTKLHF